MATSVYSNCFHVLPSWPYVTSASSTSASCSLMHHLPHLLFTICSCPYLVVYCFRIISNNCLTYLDQKCQFENHRLTLKDFSESLSVQIGYGFAWSIVGAGSFVRTNVCFLGRSPLLRFSYCLRWLEWYYFWELRSCQIVVESNYWKLSFHLCDSCSNCHFEVIFISYHRSGYNQKIWKADLKFYLMILMLLSRLYLVAL